MVIKDQPENRQQYRPKTAGNGTNPPSNGGNIPPGNEPPVYNPPPNDGGYVADEIDSARRISIPIPRMQWVMNCVFIGALAFLWSESQKPVELPTIPKPDISIRDLRLAERNFQNQLDVLAEQIDKDVSRVRKSIPRGDRGLKRITDLESKLNALQSDFAILTKRVHHARKIAVSQKRRLDDFFTISDDPVPDGWHRYSIVAPPPGQ